MSCLHLLPRFRRVDTVFTTLIFVWFACRQVDGFGYKVRIRAPGALDEARIASAPVKFASMPPEIVDPWRCLVPPERDC
jgi:hypothetical protein